MVPPFTELLCLPGLILFSQIPGLCVKYSHVNCNSINRAPLNTVPFCHPRKGTVNGILTVIKFG